MSRIATAIRKNREVVRDAPKCSKSRIPEPKALRTMERHVTGESNREIARVEQVDRRTVARVVRSPDFQKHIRQHRERFYALVPAAVNALEYALKEKKDARVAYQVLLDTGVVPTAEERTSALTQPPLSISDQARENLLAALSRKDRMTFDVLRSFQAKDQAYGLPEDSIYPPTQPQAGTPEANSDISNNRANNGFRCSRSPHRDPPSSGC